MKVYLNVSFLKILTFNSELVSSMMLSINDVNIKVNEPTNPKQLAICTMLNDLFPNEFRKFHRMRF